MALAALIFRKWRPLPTFGACLLFAFADAMQIRLQNKSVKPEIPVQFVQILPYLVTIIALAGFIGKSRSEGFGSRDLIFSEVFMKRFLHCSFIFCRANFRSGADAVTTLSAEQPLSW